MHLAYHLIMILGILPSINVCIHINIYSFICKELLSTKDKLEKKFKTRTKETKIRPKLCFYWHSFIQAYLLFESLLRRRRNGNRKSDDSSKGTIHELVRLLKFGFFFIDMRTWILLLQFENLNTASLL